MLLRTAVILMLLVLALPAVATDFTLFGYQWTTDSGNAPGGGTFAPANVVALASSFRLTLTQTPTSSGYQSVGAEVRTLERFGYGTFEWTEYVPAQMSGQVSSGFLYYQRSRTEIDVEQEGDFPSIF